MYWIVIAYVVHKMKKMLNKLHPMLILNKIFANIIFVVTVNVLISAVLICHYPEGEVDIGMSWFTLIMDQIIICAGWIIYIRNQRFLDEERARGKRMEKMLITILGNKDGH